jgi:hypothetical protein
VQCTTAIDLEILEHSFSHQFGAIFAADARDRKAKPLMMPVLPLVPLAVLAPVINVLAAPSTGRVAAE